MTLRQHPLSSAFPAMDETDFQALKDGLLQLSQQDIEVIARTPWFLSLSASQRAAYMVTWCDWLERGSNQHTVRISEKSPRAATRTMCAALEKAAS